MSTIRVVKNSNYTVLNNTVLNDERLTWKAKGVAAYLLSKPDDWKIIRENLKKKSDDGETAVKTALAELEECGYLVRTRRQNEQGQFEWESVLHETPLHNRPKSKKADKEPLVENPPMVNPPMDNPPVENPLVENHGLLNTDIPNTDVLKEKGAGAPNLFQAADPEPQQPVTETLDYSSLPANDLRRIEHLRGLGIVDPETKPAAKAKKDHQIRVNNEGLTERLRTALVDELIVIREAEALIALGNEDDLMDLQRLAEELYRMGVDSAEKMKALGVLWKQRNSILPHGRLLVKFQSQLMAEQKSGESSPNKNGGKHASNGRGRGNAAESGGQLAEWESKHGPLTFDTQISDRILKKWPIEEQREYHRKRNACRAEQTNTTDELSFLPGWYLEESSAGTESGTLNLFG